LTINWKLGEEFASPVEDMKEAGGLFVQRMGSEKGVRVRGTNRYAKADINTPVGLFKVGAFGFRFPAFATKIRNAESKCAN
jgi:hypothetical protein